jgi:PAS domain S-box-containing protein
VRRAGEALDVHGRRRDGSTFPVEVSYVAVVSDAGTEVAVSIRDVTQRHRAESELRNALSLLGATLESTADGILVVSSTGQIAGANDRFAQMWGIPDDLLASHDDERVMEFVLDQLVDAPGFVAKVHELYDHPDAESNDVLEFRDGRIFERYSRPQRVGEVIVGRVWSFRDVTPRRVAQEQARRALADLSEADARFRALVESSDDPILSTAPDGAVTSWNAAAEGLFGYAREEILQRPFALLVPDGDRREALEIHRLALEEGSVRRSIEADLRRKDGSLVPVSLTVSPIYDGERIAGASAIVRDITEARARQVELEEAQEAAEKAARAKSDFLATMSHEIRTPMNGVIGLTGLLLDTSLDDLQRRYATGIRGAGEALLGIVNDILDFSKLEAGKVALEQVALSPRRLVEEVGVLLDGAAREQGLDFRVHCDAAVPASVTGDPGRLRQVLINLTGNALKFTPAGEVVLRVATVPAQPGSDEALLRFEVRDTGIGIEAEALPRLFEPFSQADASTTRRFGGTGLGLAISRRLVRAMGGDLEVSSTPGQGSTFGFTLRLPTARRTWEGTAGPATAAAARPATQQREGAPGGLVLVAEDNPVNQMVALGFLAQLGYRTQLVADGVQALRALGTTRFDAVLMDCHMPEMDGFETTRRLRGLENGGGHTPVIAMTAGVLDEDRERCLAAGMDDFVAKPIDVEHLRDALARCVDGHEPGPPTEGTRPPALDPARLESLRRLGAPDGWGVLPAAIRLFLAGADEQAASLRERAQAGDADGLLQAAHGLRGAAANLGAAGVAAACAAVEEQVRASGSVPGDRSVGRVADELAAACSELRLLLDQAP